MQVLEHHTHYYYSTQKKEHAFCTGRFFVRIIIASKILKLPERHTLRPPRCFVASNFNLTIGNYINFHGGIPSDSPRCFACQVCLHTYTYSKAMYNLFHPSSPLLMTIQNSPLAKIPLKQPCTIHINQKGEQV